MITLNGKNIREFGLYCESQERPLTPNIIARTKYIPGRRGVISTGTEIREAAFKFNLSAIDKNKTLLEKKLDDFKAFLVDDKGNPKEIKLEFDYEPGKHYKVKLASKIDVTRISRTGKFAIRLNAYEPYKFGAEITTSITENTIINRGTLVTTGVITVNITDPTSLLTVKLVGTDKKITLGHDFIANDTVVIDLEGEKVYKNTHSIMADCYIESDFFDIPTGEFNISVSSGSAALRFKERWL